MDKDESEIYCAMSAGKSSRSWVVLLIYSSSFFQRVVTRSILRSSSTFIARFFRFYVLLTNTPSFGDIEVGFPINCDPFFD